MLLTLVNSNTYAELFYGRLDNVSRLKGPIDILPQVKVSQTKNQGGDCGSKPTHDLVLVFERIPESWIQDLPATLASYKNKNKNYFPCETLARPVKEGYEIRLSYLKPALGTQFIGSQLKTLVFKTSDSLVIDHWITRTPKPVKKEVPYWNTGTDFDSGSAGVPLKLSGTLLDVFEDQMEWEKALGSSVTAYDLNSPELDRFRWPQADPLLGISTEPIEKRKLELPYFDFPSLDQPVGFAEEKIEFKKDFTEADLYLEKATHKPNANQIKQMLDGLNFVVLLARQGDWLRAQKALEVLEKSQIAKFIPKNNMQLGMLRGFIFLRLSTELKDKNFQAKGISIWRDGLRAFAGEGGPDVEFLEKMLLETLRILFKENLSYAAAGTLSWAQGYSWSKRTEERLGYLRGEAYFQLGLYDESFKTFERFFSSRKDKPLNTSVDRRLVPAAAFRLGDIRIRQEKYPEAKMEYTRGINQIPTLTKFSFEGSWYPNELALFPHVFFNRAEANLRLGLEQNALKDLRSFIFIAPNHPQVGLVLFRIGEVLKSLGAADDMVMNAWRECIFRVPETLGAKLCEARKAALEMASSPKTNWPRLIGTVEAALPKGTKNFWDSVSAEDLEVYINLVLAEAFIKVSEPQQAWLRLESVKFKEPTAYLRAWLHEFNVVSLAGVMDSDISKGAYQSVVKEYERRKSVLFFSATRSEILWRVAKAYERLRLLGEAKATLDQADLLKTKVGRIIIRPFDPPEDEWKLFRAQLETDILAENPLNKEATRMAIDSLSLNNLSTHRLWVRFGELADEPKVAKTSWEFIDKKEGLSWEDVEKYARTLFKLNEQKNYLALLERTVGVWFGEKEKILTAENNQSSKTPPLSILLKLAEARYDVEKNLDKSLAVLDFLLVQNPAELKKYQLSIGMLMYRKGLVFKQFGKLNEARGMFVTANQTEPESLWGKLSASEVKEMDSKSQNSSQLR
jgi:tetratricopeptide (TPR) repeat protein